MAGKDIVCHEQPFFYFVNSVGFLPMMKSQTS